jgi:hypothetical protein
LIETLEPAVGTGVEKDYAEFFEAIQTLYGDASRPRRPIELTRLTLLAGCAISHTAVLQLVYTFLGGYLCKDWRSSTGDRLCSRPYEFLPSGLKCYLHGDVQQVAVTAWVAVTTWVAHLFPDSTLVTRCRNLMPMGLLSWWAEFAVKGLMLTGDWNEPRPGYTTHQEGAIQKAGVPRTDSTHELLRLCPTWPAITSGGCREFHTAGVFLRTHYSLLRRAAAEVWPDYDTVAVAHMFTLGVDSAVLPSPSMGPVTPTSPWLPQVYDHPFFRLPPDQVTRDAMFAAAEAIGLPKRPVMLLYHKMDVARAIIALELWEREPQRIHNLLGKQRGGLLVRDCREYLWSIGRLREREETWQDPFHLGELAAAKKARMVAHIQRQWDTQEIAACQRVDKQIMLEQKMQQITDTTITPGPALASVLFTLGADLETSALTLTGRGRSARRRRKKQYAALEAAGLRTPRPQPSSSKVGGVLAELRPDLTVRTEPVGIPPPPAATSPYMPETEAISDEESPAMELDKGELSDEPEIIEERIVGFVSKARELPDIEPGPSILVPPTATPRADPTRRVRFRDDQPPALRHTIGTARGRPRRPTHTSSAPKRPASPPHVSQNKPPDTDEGDVLIMEVSPADRRIFDDSESAPADPPSKRRK